MKCTNCGASLSDSAKFCAECGTKVVREVFCAQCGTKLSAGAKFCPECGTKVGAAATPDPKAESAPKAQKESSPKDNGSSKWLTIEDGVLTHCDDEAEGEVIIPEGVTEIGEEAFQGCKKITSVVIPEGVTVIGGRAFCGCTAIASVVIPDSVTEIGYDAFKYCNITELSHPCLTIKGGVAIEDGEVQYCASQAREIVIPEGVTKIGDFAFRDCKALSSVVIPDGVTEIEWSAFRDCKALSSVVIPESVTEIDSDAFYGCNITELSHPCLTIKGGVAIKDRVAKCCASQASKIVIPAGVTKIYSYAFKRFKELEAVEIPDSVTKISTKAFEECESLSSITFGGTKKEWKAVEKGDDWHEGVPAKGVECSDGMVKFGLFG